MYYIRTEDTVAKLKFRRFLGFLAEDNVVKNISYCTVSVLSDSKVNILDLDRMLYATSYVNDNESNEKA